MFSYITITYEQVKIISETGFTFELAEGRFQFLDFEECYQNYVMKRTDREQYNKQAEQYPNNMPSYEKHVARIKSFRQVAIRNAFGDSYPYQSIQIESPIQHWIFFHANEPVLVTYKDYDQFNDMQVQMHTKGEWLTWDSG